MCSVWLMHMCDATHSYVWHDSIMCVAWLIHICDMTQSYVWQGSFDTLVLCALSHSCTCVTWLNHMCDMTHLTHVWCVVLPCTPRHVVCGDMWCLAIHTYIYRYGYRLRARREVCLTCHITHMNESCHTYEWVMSHAERYAWHATSKRVTAHTESDAVSSIGSSIIIASSWHDDSRDFESIMIIASSWQCWVTNSRQWCITTSSHHHSG